MDVVKVTNHVRIFPSETKLLVGFTEDLKRPHIYQDEFNLKIMFEEGKVFWYRTEYNTRDTTRGTIFESREYIS